MRGNTDHHCVSIYPLAIAEELKLPRQSQCFSFGVRLYDYQAIRDGVAFLRSTASASSTCRRVVPRHGLHRDRGRSDGNLVQLYYYMEQIGWDGKPKPASLRRKIDNANWPETVQPLSDTFNGEPFLGPWA